MKAPLALILGWLLLWPAGGLCAPSGDDILGRIDDNMSSKTRILTHKMVIHERRISRTIEAKTWAEGEKRAFTEYLSPPRERGTKMLKLQDQLWTYTPDTDRTIRISGHMLRQSVMGSDLSYEDMMEDPRLVHNYQAQVSGQETVEGRVCWVLQLTAKTTEIAYQTRRLWVDQERFIPLREELLAKSGKLLKRMELSDVTRLEDRWYPRRMVFKDMLKTGEGTEFIVDSIVFDVEIPEAVFSKAALKK